MRTFVSLWSADLLDVGRAIDLVEKHTDGFHIDVMDGHYVPGLLFGSDFASAVCGRTAKPVEVHLMVAEPDRWIESFASAGCARIVIHPDSTDDPARTLRAIEGHGVRAGVALGIDEAPEGIEPYLESVDRVLVMGTALGIKGVEPDVRSSERVAKTVALRNRTARRPKIYVDGGIRRQTVPLFAEAGADGVIPGSLVFADPNPASVLDWIESLHPAVPTRDSSK
jgi:ribulose-phosphate 3-epimerase